MAGLAVPDDIGVAPPATAPGAVSTSIGGVMTMMNGAAFAAADAAEKQRIEALVAVQQATPVIQGLAAHIRAFWTKAKEGRTTVEQEMIEAMYCRRGEYTPTRLAKIAESKQPAIYMMLGASKMRQVESLLRDVLLGTGADKPWTLKPTPDPTLPPDVTNSLVEVLTQEVQQVINMGVFPSMEEVRQRLRLLREQVDTHLREEAVIRTERMERKMEDQLAEGSFLEAFDAFISDLSTFKTAYLKGPVVRKRPVLTWGQNGDMVVSEELALHWERADPFNIYPAPWARHIGEGPLIERHRLTREELSQMIGVDGYDENAIRKVLDEHGSSGLHDWLSIDSQRDSAAGKDLTATSENDGLIDALQYWGSASGKMLREWGMTKAQVPDDAKEYQIEAWLVGSYVIKAVLNADPLARRPYYADSFSRIPGSVWGNSPYDLLKDCQDMCNAAARALAANLGISSGPQVAVMTNRLASGEELTEMFPWKIWQFEADPMGGNAAPISFFQPQSNAQELMGVYERFSALADEYTGIPRYMAGFDAGGAGRTASGMSMMIGNATKIIKQLVASIDTHVLTKLLERLYYYNMRYSDDADLKGDVRVVARGALSLQVKEAAQVRRNEFLQATANPIDMQIMGLEGRAELLRHAVRSLDVNSDKVVPPVQVLKERQAVMQMQQAQMAQAAMGGEQGTPAKPNQENLMNGAPTTDNFQPAGSP